MKKASCISTTDFKLTNSKLIQAKLIQLNSKTVKTVLNYSEKKANN